MILKITLVLFAAIVVSAMLRRAAAATRHAVLAAGQIAALTLPLLTFLVPPIEVVSPVIIPSVVDDGAAASAAGLGLNDGGRSGRRSISSIAITDALVAVWLFGILAIALFRITGYIRAGAIVRRAESFGEVLLSDEVDQPVTFFNRIVLPRSASSWSDGRLRAVLLHEGAHVARHDTFLGIISDAVCAIYWFHPLAWLTARRARLERERACDDVVLSQGVGSFDYASALLDVARNVRRRHASAGLAMAERPHLEQRVRAILDSATNRRATRTARMAVFVTVFATAPLLAALTTISIPLPRSGEPDLRGDAVASPFSERIGAPPIEVAATGPDAALIATLQQLTTLEPRSPIDFVADRARWALARTRDGELVAPLIDALDDSDWRVRAYAGWTLGLSVDRRATAPVTALLDDPVWRVRASAANALRRLADPGASRAMHDALSDDAWQVRSEAVHYFAAIGASRELFETMRRDRHLAVRAAAEEALR